MNGLKLSVPLIYLSEQKFLIENKMTSGLQNNLFKVLSILEITTTSAFQLNSADVPSALNVNFEEIFELLLHTAGANICLSILGTT